MITPLLSTKTSELVDCWNACYPLEFHVDEEGITRLQIEHADFQPLQSIALVDGEAVQAFAVVKSSPRLRFPNPPHDFGQPADVAYLSAFAFRDEAAGQAILSTVIESFPGQPIVFGQDQRHLLPGCPEGAEHVQTVLEANGFVDENWSLDFARDLQDYVAKDGLNTDAECRLVREDDHDAVVRFFEREFPGRWRADMLEKLEIEGPKTMVTLWLHNEMHGFACIQDQSHHLKIAGAALHANYGENWCTLGPIGVSKDKRGLRLGDTILARALEHMRDSGGRTCVIDWTNLEGYYGKHGFTARRKYHLLKRPAL